MASANEGGGLFDLEIPTPSAQIQRWESGEEVYMKPGSITVQTKQEFIPRQPAVALRDGWVHDPLST
jgi:hypothetical protein